MGYLLGLSPLHLLSLALLLQVVLGENSYLSHICSNFDNYTSNGTYETNLNNLMTSLSYSVPRSRGFGYVTVGKDPDRVYGLGLCRGDVSSTDCKTCIVDAKTQILKSCSNEKEAIIWYDHCLLKYSNSDFFGKIDTKYKVYMYDTQNVSDPASFNYKVRELLNEVATDAYDDHNSKLYATGELVIDGSEKLYGLAQCTRDLSRANCKECLDDAISDLPSCCDGKQGGRILGGSCNIRYELYSFVNSN
ncbi:cysteine-rich repeat secretory protein 38-like [Telopea speciosissima]|uniref:cysteine-rich repeat secretory protein 38-like n=1 Tax=Telopea speciosissima TaxID=54955 RepID=UPI001CC5CCA3|nr:cysteine-rich repeat secretory protein 38-like [Telopea speciosissima]